MRRINFFVVVAAAAVLVGVVYLPRVSAQSETTDREKTGGRPSFEVVSIKPNPNQNPYTAAGWSGDIGHEMIRFAPPAILITLAYNIEPFQLSGGPPWIKTERFDIDAKPDDATIEKMKVLPRGGQLALERLMFQSLLADRFKLVIHRATAIAPMYTLVVSRSGRMKEVGDCPAKPKGPIDTPPKPCGAAIVWGGHIDEYHVPMSSLIHDLMTMTGKMVVDKTGLTGRYDVKIDWTPESARTSPPDPNNPFPASDPNGPSLQQALEDTLGLKLISTTGPVENIVIDHIEEPSPN